MILVAGTIVVLMALYDAWLDFWEPYTPTADAAEEYLRTANVRRER